MFTRGIGFWPIPTCFKPFVQTDHDQKITANWGRGGMKKQSLSDWYRLLTCTACHITLGQYQKKYMCWNVHSETDHFIHWVDVKQGTLLELNIAMDNPSFIDDVLIETSTGTFHCHYSYLFEGVIGVSTAFLLSSPDSKKAISYLGRTYILLPDQRLSDGQGGHGFPGALQVGFFEGNTWCMFHWGWTLRPSRQGFMVVGCRVFAYSDAANTGWFMVIYGDFVFRMLKPPSNCRCLNWESRDELENLPGWRSLCTALYR